MSSVFVVMIENDCHEPEIHVFGIEQEAIEFAEDKASDWCEDGYKHESGKAGHCFSSKADDDCFYATVFERQVVER